MRRWCLERSSSSKCLHNFEGPRKGGREEGVGEGVVWGGREGGRSEGGKGGGVREGKGEEGRERGREGGGRGRGREGRGGGEGRGEGNTLCTLQANILYYGQHHSPFGSPMSSYRGHSSFTEVSALSSAARAWALACTRCRSRDASTSRRRSYSSLT